MLERSNKSRTNLHGLDIYYNDEVIMDSRIISIPQFLVVLNTYFLISEETVNTVGLILL